MNKEKFYITTPIYYPSDNLHIGHSYCTVATDTMARYKRMRGYDVMFLTGTDEHGQKIERVAEQNGVTPKEYVDKIVAGVKELWELMDISYDRYIRTTDEIHETAVQKIFEKLYQSGDIYKSEYEGWYCTPCEAFFTELQLDENHCCPDCHRSVEKVKEESYFFKLSKYQDRIIKHLEENPEFLQPTSRRNEMINNFLKPGLDDLCVSRTSFKWGIPVTFDPKHVVYVWIDALSNYITALGYGSDNDEDFKRYWPADVHIVGKEIVRFHAIIWPAMLMALDLPLPKKVFGHGWLVIDGNKMSKSVGNVVDPKVLCEKYGVDAIRYFLLREVAFGQDGNFTNEVLLQRINSDLANDLGNLLSRTVGMIDKYFGGQLPLEQIGNEFDKDIIDLAKQTVAKVEDVMENMHFSDALDSIWKLVRRCNKYIDETSPWVLSKDDAKKGELANIMYTLCESLRIIGVMITPFMPNTPKVIFTQLSVNNDSLKQWNSIYEFGKLNRDIKVQKGDIVFPRIDIKKELEALAIEQEEARKNSVTDTPINIEETSLQKRTEFITIDDFAKVNLKVGEVLECERVDGADKLLKSQIKIGEEIRTILSGIAKHYTPEQMVGKKVVVVTNLPARKMRGIMSEGMILAASNDDGTLNLLTVDGDIENGAEIS